MKPAAFGYLAPRTREEAIAALSRYAGDAKVLAGGQSLVPLLNFRLTSFRYLVDINRIQDLDYIRTDGDHLAVGALARHRTVERSVDAARACALLPEALELVGHPVIRQRGTVCGSIAHADPSAELPAVLTALGGSVVLDGPSGRRTVEAEDFFLGYLMTSLQPDELVVETRFPMLPSGTGVAFEELARRHGDFAIVGVACAALPDGSLRLGICGANSVPFRPRDAEAAAAQGDLVEAGRLAAAASDPDGDLHATAEYRRSMVSTLVQRAARSALERKEGYARG
jgi:CO/xanthine dehydrogenase FAD-binding subunit